MSILRSPHSAQAALAARDAEIKRFRQKEILMDNLEEKLMQLMNNMHAFQKKVEIACGLLEADRQYEAYDLLVSMIDKKGQKRGAKFAREHKEIKNDR